MFRKSRNGSGSESWTMRKTLSPIDAARKLSAPLAPPPEHAQKLITPDCPKCGAVLWSVACEVCAPRVHYFCEACQVEYSYSPAFGEWVRFDLSGQVIEIIPPRTVGTLPGREGGPYLTQGNSNRFFAGKKKAVAE